MDNASEDIVVVYDEKLSEPYLPRYVIKDKATGKVLDDAQGYGYKTKQKAYAAWAYKHRSPAVKAHEAFAKKAVRKFVKENRSFVNLLEADAFDIAKGSWGPDDKFDAKFVANAFKENGFLDLPFTAQEFLKYW